MSKALEKEVGESRLYDIDMHDVLAGGRKTPHNIQTVQSVTATPAGLTIGPPSTDNRQLVRANFSGGADGVRYKIKVVVDTAEGDTGVVGYAWMDVRADVS
jgi:hypothetical protein